MNWNDDKIPDKMVILNNPDTVKIEESLANLAEVTQDLGNNKFKINGLVAPVGSYVFVVRNQQIWVYKCLDYYDILLDEAKPIFKRKNFKSYLLKIFCKKRVEGPLRLTASDVELVELTHLKSMENSVSVIMLLRESKTVPS